MKVDYLTRFDMSSSVILVSTRESVHGARSTRPPISKRVCEGNAAEEVENRASLLNHVSVPYRYGTKAWLVLSRDEKSRAKDVILLVM